MRNKILIHTKNGIEKIYISPLFIEGFLINASNKENHYKIYNLVEYCNYLLFNNKDWLSKNKILRNSYRMFLRYMELFMKYDYGYIIEIKN